MRLRLLPSAARLRKAVARRKVSPMGWPASWAWYARYRAYQARLTGQPIGETFRRATAFLNLAADGSSLSRT